MGHQSDAEFPLQPRKLQLGVAGPLGTWGLLVCAVCTLMSHQFLIVTCKSRNIKVTPVQLSLYARRRGIERALFAQDKDWSRIRLGKLSLLFRDQDMGIRLTIYRSPTTASSSYRTHPTKQIPHPRQLDFL